MLDVELLPKAIQLPHHWNRSKNNFLISKYSVSGLVLFVIALVIMAGPLQCSLWAYMLDTDDTS